jgi:glycosyltransferase involved in cell wall biosynthesis
MTNGAPVGAHAGKNGSELACELSVVIPCLNEGETLGSCIRKAVDTMRAHGIPGEVVVADNGSTDNSVRIATDLGARVVQVPARGYGNALMGGINAARGRYVIMGDADDSYDFREVARFLAKLREGYDLVQGCRLPSGGGTVLPGAMKPLHRWLGNPMFSFLARALFGAPIHDIYCGMRGFTREMYDRLDLHCTGMEFATEMIIKASLFREKIAEVPITLHPDGRKEQRSHLRTFRDGWRTLRFFMCFSPRALFLVPGLTLMGLGLLGFALALLGIGAFGAALEGPTLLAASLALILGYQGAQFGILAKTFAVSEGLLPTDKRLQRFQRRFKLERGLLIGASTLVAGGVLLAAALGGWWPSPDPPGGLGAWRLACPAATLLLLGSQTILSSFLMSILRMRRK